MSRLRPLASRTPWTLLAFLLVIGNLAVAGPFAPGTNEWVSVATDGTQGDGWAREMALSGDGHVVVFSSEATTMVPGDTNGAEDVFVRDRLAGTTVRVSVATDGTQANADSKHPWISYDGQRIAFASRATTLDPADTNDRPDIFIHDRTTGETRRIPWANPVAAWPWFSLSGDGQHVAFRDLQSHLTKVVSLETGAIETVSVDGAGQPVPSADHFLTDPALSFDGRVVAFATAAALVPTDTDAESDVYVRDRDAGTIELVSTKEPVLESEVTRTPAFAPALSANGRIVAFQAFPTLQVDPLDVFVLDRDDPGNVHVLRRAAFGYGHLSMSADGDRLALATPGIILTSTILWPGAYRWTVSTGELELLTLDRNGLPTPEMGASAAISADGLVVAFGGIEGSYVEGDTNGVNDFFVRITS